MESSQNIPLFAYSLTENNKIDLQSKVTHQESLNDYRKSNQQTEASIIINQYRQFRAKSEIVSQILEVFRPKDEQEVKQFLENKKIVTTAVCHIFEDQTIFKQNKTLQKKTNSQRKIGFIRNMASGKKKIEQFVTPVKKKNTTETKRSNNKLWSDSIRPEGKISFAFYETKYSQKDIQALQIRSGYKKI